MLIFNQNESTDLEKVKEGIIRKIDKEIDDYLLTDFSLTEAGIFVTQRLI